MFRELTPAQSREFIDAAQAFEALMSTEQKRLGYAGGMHWKSVRGNEYLYRTTGGRGQARSLGRRDETRRQRASMQISIAGRRR